MNPRLPVSVWVLQLGTLLGALVLALPEVNALAAILCLFSPVSSVTFVSRCIAGCEPNHHSVLKLSAVLCCSSQQPNDAFLVGHASVFGGSSLCWLVA
jgi:hypothetical protein